MSKDTIRMKILELCNDLEEYARLEGTELGDGWRGLIGLGRVCSYLGDREFSQTIRDKLEEELDRAEEHFEIVEEEETRKRRTLKRKR